MKVFTRVLISITVAVLSLFVVIKSIDLAKYVMNVRYPNEVIGLENKVLPYILFCSLAATLACLVSLITSYKFPKFTMWMFIFIAFSSGILYSMAPDGRYSTNFDGLLMDCILSILFSVLLLISHAIQKVDRIQKIDIIDDSTLSHEQRNEIIRRNNMSKIQGTSNRTSAKTGLVIIAVLVCLLILGIILTVLFKYSVDYYNKANNVQVGNQVGEIDSDYTKKERPTDVKTTLTDSQEVDLRFVDKEGVVKSIRLVFVGFTHNWGDGSFMVQFGARGDYQITTQDTLVSIGRTITVFGAKLKITGLSVEKKSITFEQQ